ncbi:potassium transporter Kup [Nocardia aurantiaca]|uniref:Probable potassium transport system protein Kup n=1 Tax=Nocardia aurantiaca TaxID=2675850 RepID=A0A6I3L367_9NOCA|nr:KUP/HAK/KT family potassium transporter [Nocardia aurantiaca]MTE15728.1 potassium transporter Kup [Nocardia aurantiaca]
MPQRHDSTVPADEESAGQSVAATENRKSVTDTVRPSLVIGALGVVFGDIGTSPIYTLRTVFDPSDPHPVPVDPGNVYGVVSLVFWSVLIIVTVTYVLLAMRADNDGEGGIMALITLVRRWAAGGRRLAAILAALGIFGAALFFGDSMITPAISVLSAVEGLEVVEPPLAKAVVPITALIIVLLFLFQHRGTASVGRLFGPVMVAWFLAIGACGIGGIRQHPAILKALSPGYALGFLAGHFAIAFFALAAIVLAVTGAEALYADLGHFGRRSITRAWLFLVLPACVLSYFGQAALVLGTRGHVASPFFLMVPGWGRLPMVALATAATVIASQAVITGAYSVASQAAQIGYLPRLRIAHTSESTPGQIYVPWVNWLLLASVLTLIFAFRSSTALAFAFGMAVTCTITITTLLLGYLAHAKWRLPLWLVVAVWTPLLAVDLLFVAANLTKLVRGAWLPLLIGLAAFMVMTTWQRGREVVAGKRERLEGPLREFVDELWRDGSRLVTIDRTAVFLNRGKETVPLALRANVEHNGVRHRQIVIASVETEPVPRVSAEDRVRIDHLGYRDDGIVHVTVRGGYMETPDVPAALAGLDPEETEGELDLDHASYFLSEIELRAAAEPVMSRWRTRLFIAIGYLSADVADYFRLPRQRTVILGERIEV